MNHTESLNPFSRQAARVVQARDAERERMARDLHDVLGNELAVLKFETHLVTTALEKSLASEPNMDIARVLQRTRQINALLDGVIQSSRQIVHDYHPRVLQERGLVAAIEEQAARFQRRTDIPCTVSSNEDAHTLTGEASLALYRITQEALGNVMRHARASRVLLRLRATSRGVKLDIIDDGIGLPDTLGHGGGYGLSNMHERMRAVGGEFSIQSSPGKGTRITCQASAALPGLRPTALGARRM